MSNNDADELLTPELIENMEDELSVDIVKEDNNPDVEIEEIGLNSEEKRNDDLHAWMNSNRRLCRL